MSQVLVVSPDRALRRRCRLGLAFEGIGCEEQAEVPSPDDVEEFQLLIIELPEAPAERARLLDLTDAAQGPDILLLADESEVPERLAPRLQSGAVLRRGFSTEELGGRLRKLGGDRLFRGATATGDSDDSIDPLSIPEPVGLMSLSGALSQVDEEPYDEREGEPEVDLPSSTPIDPEPPEADGGEPVTITFEDLDPLDPGEFSDLATAPPPPHPQPDTGPALLDPEGPAIVELAPELQQAVDRAVTRQLAEMLSGRGALGEEFRRAVDLRLRHLLRMAEGG